jgi:hypothetical protein
MGTYSDLLQENIKPAQEELPKQPKGSQRPERVERSVRPERPVRVIQEPGETAKPQRREIRRHSFEIYKDQVTGLQELRVTMMKRGELKSMSAMVREAIDAYLKKQT